MFGEKENIGIFQSIELRATKHTHVADKNCRPKLLKPLVIFGDSQETPKIFMLKVLLFYVFSNVWRTGPSNHQSAGRDAEIMGFRGRILGLTAIVPSLVSGFVHQKIYFAFSMQD